MRAMCVSTLGRSQFQVHITTGGWFTRGNELCAGSAISDYHVLTGGHCVWDTYVDILFTRVKGYLTRRDGEVDSDWKCLSNESI